MKFNLIKLKRSKSSSEINAFIASYEGFSTVAVDIELLVNNEIYDVYWGSRCVGGFVVAKEHEDLRSNTSRINKMLKQLYRRLFHSDKAMCIFYMWHNAHIVQRIMMLPLLIRSVYLLMKSQDKEYLGLLSMDCSTDKWFRRSTLFFEIALRCDRLSAKCMFVTRRSSLALVGINLLIDQVFRRIRNFLSFKPAMTQQTDDLNRLSKVERELLHQDVMNELKDEYSFEEI